MDGENEIPQKHRVCVLYKLYVGFEGFCIHF